MDRWIRTWNDLAEHSPGDIAPAARNVARGIPRRRACPNGAAGACLAGGASPFGSPDRRRGARRRSGALAYLSDPHYLDVRLAPTATAMLRARAPGLSAPRVVKFVLTRPKPPAFRSRRLQWWDAAKTPPPIKDGTWSTHPVRPAVTSFVRRGRTHFVIDPAHPSRR